MLPVQLRAELESALGSAVTDVRTLGGGCISNATRIELANGERAFLKWGSDPSLFRAEADALHALRATGTVRVPHVIAVGDWLLLEWLEPAHMSDAAWERLGHELARLHRTQREEFGWATSNFIGTLPQRNEWSRSWPSFWRDQRIAPQLDNMHGQQRRRIESLLERVDDLLRAGDQDGASLLHGDLWGGNVHGVATGAPALIDPSIYYGHREVDLAMASLFGGFSRRFFDAYEEAWPLQPGHEQRRAFYQLYYMLVHVNLFGGSYVSGTMSLVGKLGF